MSDPWQIMDDWCREQCRKLTARSTPFVMNGGDLDDREYRRWLGQHQAFCRMRSFIHGARNAASCDRSGEAIETATQIAGSTEGESAVAAKRRDAQHPESPQ